MAIAGIALGLTVMIVSIAIVTGFKIMVRNKVIGFGSHIQIGNYDSNLSFESSPISKLQDFYPSLDTIEGIKHIQVYANKAGIIKTDDEIQGVVLKGVDSDYDWSFFKDRIIDGNVFEVNDTVKTNKILISKSIASRLRFKAGDDVRMYFLTEGQSSPRGRKFEIEGVFETGLEEFDNMFIIGDIKHIQKINKWSDDMIAGFEVIIDDFDELDKLGLYIYNKIGYDLDTQTIKQLYPQIFDWLELQDMNVWVILVLMVAVAAITMISTLLILILERTNMIGILKALGSKDWSIRKIFLYNAVYIIGKGLMIGNIFGIGLCLLQKYFKLIALPVESYFVSYVPINLSLTNLILINSGTLVVCVLMLIIPSYVITRITPVKAIRFS